MTVPERISDFLVQRLELMYCDTCVQERLGLKWRQQVQLITAMLAVTNGFRREFNRCCTCQEMKQVTHAADSTAGTELQKLSVGHWRPPTRLVASAGSDRAQDTNFAGRTKPEPFASSSANGLKSTAVQGSKG